MSFNKVDGLLALNDIDYLAKVFVAFHVDPVFFFLDENGVII